MTEGTISHSNFFLISIVLVAVGFAIGYSATYSNTPFAEADIEDATRAEMMAEISTKYVSHSELENTITVLREQIADAIAAPHTEFADIDTSISDVREDITDLKIELAKLELKIDGTGTPTQGTISVSVDSSCYERGDVVHFSGMATPSRQLTSSIYIDKDDFEGTPTTNTASNGEYDLFWVIPSDAEYGTYVAKLKDSAGKYGETTVNVEDNC